MPGLMGFGETSLKNMRKFYEAWAYIEDKSTTMVADLQLSDSEPITIRQPELANYEDFPLEEFLAVPFTHHIRILEKVKETKRSLLYICHTALSHLSKEALLKSIAEDDFHHHGAFQTTSLLPFLMQRNLVLKVIPRSEKGV